MIFVTRHPIVTGGTVSTQVKTKPDDTRVRIMDAAEALFRRLGFGKTAVADIAAELRMSPANVYRFFPSKNAIVEAICQRCLGELEEKAWAAARSRGSAAERIERLVLETLAYHKDNHLTDQRVNDMVLAAIELSWGAIRAHKEHMRMIFESILRDGVGTGEFESHRPARDLPAADVIAGPVLSPGTRRPVAARPRGPGSRRPRHRPLSPPRHHPPKLIHAFRPFHHQRIGLPKL